MTVLSTNLTKTKFCPNLIVSPNVLPSNRPNRVLLFNMTKGFVIKSDKVVLADSSDFVDCLRNKEQKVVLPSALLQCPCHQSLHKVRMKYTYTAAAETTRLSFVSCTAASSRKPALCSGQHSFRSDRISGTNAVAVALALGGSEARPRPRRDTKS